MVECSADKCSVLIASLVSSSCQAPPILYDRSMCRCDSASLSMSTVWPHIPAAMMPWPADPDTPSLTHETDPIIIGQLRESTGVLAGCSASQHLTSIYLTATRERVQGVMLPYQ